MCYEERYFSEWARNKARKRDEQQPKVDQRRVSEPRPERTKQEPARTPEKVERDLETV